MVLKEIECDGVDWMDLVQEMDKWLRWGGPLVNAVLNLKGSKKIEEFLD